MLKLCSVTLVKWERTGTSSTFPSPDPENRESQQSFAGRLWTQPHLLRHRRSSSKKPKNPTTKPITIKRERTLDLRILLLNTKPTSTFARTSIKVCFTSGNGTRPPQPVLFLLADRSHLLDLSAPVHACTLKSCPQRPCTFFLLPLVHDITPEPSVSMTLLTLV